MIIQQVQFFFMTILTNFLPKGVLVVPRKSKFCSQRRGGGTVFALNVFVKAVLTSLLSFHTHTPTRVLYLEWLAWLPLYTAPSALARTLRHTEPPHGHTHINRHTRARVPHTRGRPVMLLDTLLVRKKPSAMLPQCKYFRARQRWLPAGSQDGSQDGPSHSRPLIEAL